jgi:nicotinamidase/pyrazinamidase
MLIGGLATDYCVKQTVLDALKMKSRQEALGRKVVVIVLTDAVRAVNLQEDDGEKALQEMQEAGAVLLTTDEAITRIQNGEL